MNDKSDDADQGHNNPDGRGAQTESTGNDHERGAENEHFITNLVIIQKDRREAVIARRVVQERLRPLPFWGSLDEPSMFTNHCFSSVIATSLNVPRL